jgi:5-formyltetrahydrofolate cyclo-ligase
VSDKANVRSDLERSLRNFCTSKELKNQAEQSLSQHLLQTLQNKTGVWGVFKPHHFEPDLSEVVTKSPHLHWAYPVVVDKHLQWWMPGPAGFSPGTFGIHEPLREGPKAGTQIRAEDLDGILIPGLGFTSQGVRLGRGRGFFDRSLPGLKAEKIGVAFACQLRTELPMEAHDVRMDLVVTQHGVAHQNPSS